MIFPTSYLPSIINILNLAGPPRAGFYVANAGDYQRTLGPSTNGDSLGYTVPHVENIDGESQIITIPSSGGDRNFSIHLPATYNPTRKYSLMISYHGGTETMEEQEKMSRFSRSSVNPQMIVVYPQGIKVCSFPVFFPHHALWDGL